MFAQESVMDIQKEKIKQEFWNWAKVENPRVVENAELGDVYAIQILDHMFMGFAAAKAQAVPEVKDIGNELQSWVAVWSFKARHDREDYIVVDANLLAEKIEKLTGANA